jgi:serine/threonine protein kinase
MIDSYGHIKLVDFRLSTFDDAGTVRKSVCRTINYIAPEILNGEPYSKVVDWWSYGAIIYEMITGYQPFIKQNNTKTGKKFSCFTNTQIELSEKLSSSLKDFVTKLLQPNPKERLGAKGINEIMNHKFFKGIDWMEVRDRMLSPTYVPKIKSRDHVILSHQEILTKSLEYEENILTEKHGTLKCKHFKNFTFTETSSNETTKEEQ